MPRLPGAPEVGCTKVSNGRAALGTEYGPQGKEKPLEPTCTGVPVYKHFFKEHVDHMLPT